MLGTGLLLSIGELANLLPAPKLPFQTSLLQDVAVERPSSGQSGRDPSPLAMKVQTDLLQRICCDGGIG